MKKALHGKSKLIALTLAVMAIVFALAIVGCSPANQTSSDSNDKASDASAATTTEKTTDTADATTSTVSDMSFFNKDSGNLFPDNYTNTTLLNIGHRGCNSCHPDLAAKMGEPDRPALHAVVETGYDMNLTIKDCGSCHGLAAGFYSPYLGDLLHGAHYSNQTFIEDYDGNCWSCHSIEMKDGEWDIVLWEEAMYDPELGGYKDASTNYKAREWVRDHGHGSDYLSGIATEADPQLDVTLDQFTTDDEDRFVVYNYPPDNVDMEKVCDPSNTLTLKGVNNEKSFTVDDLKGMNVVTETVGHACVTNGKGGNLVGNFDYTGVKLSDLIAECGGLVDGANVATIHCYDGWEFAHNALPADIYTEDAMIAFQLNGKDLDEGSGAPMLLVLPGMPGGAWGKYIQEITFQHVDDPVNILSKATAAPSYQGLMNYINSGWFHNDGYEVNLGETVDLNGWAWGWVKTNSPAQKISFSTDGGVTWVDYDIPADFDPLKITQFNFKWTPSEAGTYILKVNAFNADGQPQYEPSSLIIKVNA